MSPVPLIAGKATEALSPPHTYVPWVVVNGVPLWDDYASLAQYVCVAFTRKERPKACFEAPPGVGPWLHRPNILLAK